MTKQNNGMTQIETMSVDDFLKLIEEYKSIHTNPSASCSPDYSVIRKELEDTILRNLKVI